MSSTPPFTLSKSFIRQIFQPLTSTTPSVRSQFFQHLSPTLTWTVCGPSHSLTGTRTSLKTHNEASFVRCGRYLQAPIKFIVTRVLIDHDGDEGVVEHHGASGEQQDPAQDKIGRMWSVVELRGESQRIDEISGPGGSSKGENGKGRRATGGRVPLGVEGGGRGADGSRYDNEYVWLMRWNRQGKCVEIRSYCDTLLAEELMRDGQTWEEGGGVLEKDVWISEGV